MAEKKKKGRYSNARGPTTPTQEGDADILAEAGAEFNEDRGEFLTDQESVRALGAVDVESVRENRRLKETIRRKRDGEKGIVINADDLLTKYDVTVQCWSPNTFEIKVQRLAGGGPLLQFITNCPRSGAELYEALKAIHGQHAEAEYSVKVADHTSKEYRCNGRITMPDTRPAGQQGYPMPPPYYPPQPQPQYPPQYPQQAPPQPQAPPQTPTASSGASPDPMAMMQQAFQMLQQMRDSFQAQQPPAPQMPPMPTSPPGATQDPMAMMQQMFQLLQQMQPQPQPGTQQQAAPTPAPIPQPPQPAPTPQIDPMAMMRQMFDMFRDYQEMMQAMQPPREEPPRRPYFPPADRPFVPPQRQPTAAEQFRDAISVVRTAVDATRELNSLVPQQHSSEAETAAYEPDEESPVKIIDTGAGRLVVDKKTGSLRGWETGWANMDKMLKWVADQREEIQRANARSQAPTQQRQLPPGYVEVTEGYEPPPGFVAVPVDLPRSDDLPPPPEQAPPPLQPRSWEPPVMPDGENG